ncbi:MAG TPA: V-type ATP synthase subunit F [Desulfatiglandales bacterium]|jgi:vacuolar-type H+-ATPase subunit F/Vma7|nr:V-type ATP synthase subunit F [Desulfatiglandales bacterium]
MEIALIGDRHAAYGFKLAGVKQTFLIDELKTRDVREALRSLFNGNIGIILITEKAATEIRSALDEVSRFRKGIMPIILEIPDSGGPLVGKTDPMRGLIKRTVGFEIA